MNKYNPQIHHRRSIRLKGYNYAKAGLYFITICCQDRVHRFGHIEKGEMHLNEFGRIAYEEWLKLGVRFINFELDVFQIMPNHMHGIISLIDTPVGAGLAPAQNDIDNIKERAGASPAPTGNSSISDIIGAYKSLVSKGCLDICKSKNEILGKLWQRNYYEHIIRNEYAYNRISAYIINNPAKWSEDKFY
jgi:putative transposase